MNFIIQFFKKIFYRASAIARGPVQYKVIRKTMAYLGDLERHYLPVGFIFPGWGDSTWRYCSVDTTYNGVLMKKGWRVAVDDTTEATSEPPPDPDPDPVPIPEVDYSDLFIHEVNGIPFERYARIIE